MRITPTNITKLKENQIFVFGSNLSGIHGSGAAKTARKWGALYGLEEGLQGNTYAIPTKDEYAKGTLSIEHIKPYIDTFIQFTKENLDLIFLVTEIGCGLAGLTSNQVAPLFKDSIKLKNVYLPQKFYDILTI